MKKTTRNGSRSRQLVVEREIIAALTSPRLDHVAGAVDRVVECSRFSSCEVRTDLG